MKKHARISGVGDTRFGEIPGSSVIALQAEAARAAMKDAGITTKQVDGVLCGYSFSESGVMPSAAISEYLGIAPKHSTGLLLGGATACAMVMYAALLVESGRFRHVLVVAGENRLTGMSRGAAVARLAAIGHPQFEVPYGPTIPSFYALIASRYMADYGVTREQLAHIAVTMREHARLHPGAHMKSPITVKDVLESRPISTPLHLLDCCPVSDGAAAVIVSAGDAARDTRDARATMIGMGQGHTHEHLVQAPSLTSFGCAQSAATAFGEAGVSPSDIDVAEIYDSFTITLIVELESMGFFAKGQAGPEIAKGALKLGGALPTNTHGGLLSFGHSGVAGGLTHVVEGVRQLRGSAEARQVPGAELAFVHGDGGTMSSHCSIVLARQ
jgi:acetyl-CoA acetyltransferase